MATRTPKEPPVDWQAKHNQLLKQAGEMDRRRRVQVDAQKQVINRLLQNRGWSWEEEQIALLEEKVEAEAKLEAIGDYVTGMKYSNVARQVMTILGETVEPLPEGAE